MELFKNTPNIDFLSKRRSWFVVSAVLIAVSLLAPLVKSPNWGVDFAGGTEVHVRFGAAVNEADIRRALAEAGIADPSLQRFGDAEHNEYLIRMAQASLYTDAQFASEVEPQLRQALPSLAEGPEGVRYSEKDGDQVRLAATEPMTAEGVRDSLSTLGMRVQDVQVYRDGLEASVIFRGVADRVEQAFQGAFAEARPEVMRVEQVGAAVGAELKVSAIKSMVVAIALILLYVGFRFDFRFAPGGVVALAHDAIIVVGFYTVTGAEINTTTIAALLTVIGYSINDTIVVFDRVRENMAKFKGRSLDKLLNESLNQCLSRTILTSFTMVLSLVGLAVFTVGSLREFSFALLVGMVAGVYSTLFIASPLVVWIDKKVTERKEQQAKTSARVSATGA